MPAIDAQVRLYQDQIEERTAFIDNLVQSAGEGDLDATQLRLVTDATARITELRSMATPLQAAMEVSRASRDRYAEIQSQVVRGPRSPVEYRSAGAYICDHWAAHIGVEDARERMALYQRAAAHQTTQDNLGVIPEPITGALLNFVDYQRPLVTVLGPKAVPSFQFNRPRVTQHTDVALQSAEKAELISRKMLITRVPVTMSTYGGYVNVSRQDIDFSMPQIMDIVIQDLAGEYAIETEAATSAVLVAGATAQTPVITPTSTAAEVNAAVWKAAGTIFTATRGAGRVVVAASPDMMGSLAAAFPSVNPTNAFSTGFQASDLGQGALGNISGIPVIMSTNLPAVTALALSTVGTEVYEQRVGALQVIEPSVLGVQVAYAGYFKAIALVTSSIVKMTT